MDDHVAQAPHDAGAASRAVAALPPPLPPSPHLSLPPHRVRRDGGPPPTAHARRPRPATRLCGPPAAFHPHRRRCRRSRRRGRQRRRWRGGYLIVGARAGAGGENEIGRCGGREKRGGRAAGAASAAHGKRVLRRVWGGAPTPPPLHARAGPYASRAADQPQWPYWGPSDGGCSRAVSLPRPPRPRPQPPPLGPPAAVATACVAAAAPLFRCGGLSLLPPVVVRGHSRLAPHSVLGRPTLAVPEAVLSPFAPPAGSGRRPRRGCAGEGALRSGMFTNQHGTTPLLRDASAGAVASSGKVGHRLSPPRCKGSADKRGRAWSRRASAPAPAIPCRRFPPPRSAKVPAAARSVRGRRLDRPTCVSRRPWSPAESLARVLGGALPAAPSAARW